MSTSIPLPGQHRPQAAHAGAFAVDPVAVQAEVEQLLSELPAPQAADASDFVAHARILDAAHEVLVRALASVDKG